MAAMEFEILEHIGQLSESKSGWKRELTIVSWNGREAKFDLRDWSPDYKKMGKGLTLTNEELENLRDILVKMDN